MQKYSFYLLAKYIVCIEIILLMKIKMKGVLNNMNLIFLVLPLVYLE